MPFNLNFLVLLTLFIFSSIRCAHSAPSPQLGFESDSLAVSRNPLHRRVDAGAPGPPVRKIYVYFDHVSKQSVKGKEVPDYVGSAMVVFEATHNDPGLAISVIRMQQESNNPFELGYALRVFQWAPNMGPDLATMWARYSFKDAVRTGYFFGNTKSTNEQIFDPINMGGAASNSLRHNQAKYIRGRVARSWYEVFDGSFYIDRILSYLDVFVQTNEEDMRESVEEKIKNTQQRDQTIMDGSKMQPRIGQVVYQYRQSWGPLQTIIWNVRADKANIQNLVFKWKQKATYGANPSQTFLRETDQREKIRSSQVTQEEYLYAPDAEPLDTGKYDPDDTEVPGPSGTK
ncbi:MAG: hypothetical protein M1833_000279 [Piccolia ochrophora]|nr:MAG: hypothetical protein M1833_000279 [Piccolia ochrophora]